MQHTYVFCAANRYLPLPSGTKIRTQDHLREVCSLGKMNAVTKLFQNNKDRKTSCGSVHPDDHDKGTPISNGSKRESGKAG